MNKDILKQCVKRAGQVLNYCDCNESFTVYAPQCFFCAQTTEGLLQRLDYEKFWIQTHLRVFLPIIHFVTTDWRTAASAGTQSRNRSPPPPLTWNLSFFKSCVWLKPEVDGRSGKRFFLEEVSLLTGNRNQEHLPQSHWWIQFFAEIFDLEWMEDCQQESLFKERN